VRGVWGGIRHPNIEIIHPLINIAGLGIMDGNRDDMLAAIRSAVPGISLLKYAT